MAVAAALVFLAAAVVRSMSKMWVLGGLFLVGLVWASSGVVWPVFASARVARERTACVENLKHLAVSMQTYLAGNNEIFPPADRWYTLVGQGDPPQCPVATSPYSYGMNRNLSGVSALAIEEPNRTVLIFEMDGQTPNANGTEKDLVERQGHTSAAMVDGHVDQNARDKRWKP